jgi:hypothetical protein
MNTTKTAQFTQGPWKAVPDKSRNMYTWYVEGAKGVVPTIARLSLIDACEEIESNARLIAAAPAMYDRHKDNHGMVQEALRFLYEGEYEEVKCLLNHMALNSKQAIKQAEGR